MFGTQTIQYASNTKGKWSQWMVLGNGTVCLDVLCSFPQGTYRLWWCCWWWCGCGRCWGRLRGKGGGGRGHTTAFHSIGAGDLSEVSSLPQLQPLPLLFSFSWSPLWQNELKGDQRRLISLSSLVKRS